MIPAQSRGVFVNRFQNNFGPSLLPAQTSRRNDKAGIGDVRSIGADLVPGGWTVIRLRGECAVIDKQRQQSYREFRNAYGPASERKFGRCTNRARSLLLHSISRSQVTRWYLARAQVTKPP
jgi:hypothetical protein